MAERESTLDVAETITWWAVAALALVGLVFVGLLTVAIVRGSGIERTPAPYVMTAPADQQTLVPPAPMPPGPGPAPAPAGPPR